MYKSVAGVYREGKVELLEAPPDAAAGAVIVTFLSALAALRRKST